MGRKGTNGEDTTSDTGATDGTPETAPARLTSTDVQQKEFRVSRFGGYKMRDVDEFLDQITDTFTSMKGEIDRLRSGGGAAPVVGSPDLDDVSRQADEIIARARAEAARIAGQARAGSASAMSAPSGRHEREAVNAFITREREFLQSLAGLVQSHAETVKSMAKTSRAAPSQSVPRPSSSPSSAAPATSSASAAPVAAAAPSDDPAAEPAPASAPPAAPAAREPAADEAPTRVPESASGPEPTVRLDEPAPARASRGSSESDADRSLRELFWGED